MSQTPLTPSPKTSSTTQLSTSYSQKKSIKQKYFLKILQFKSSQELITFVLSLAGALAWFAPFAYDVLKKPEVEGKLISLSHFSNMSFSSEGESIEGTMYFPRIAFTSLNGYFLVKKVEPYITYAGDQSKYKGEVISTAKPIVIHIVRDGKKVTRSLEIPAEQHVRSLVALQPGQVQVMFVPFIVPRKDSPFEQMEYRVYDFAGHSSTFLISKEDIDVKSILLDNQYWRDLPQDQPEQPENSNT